MFCIQDGPRTAKLPPFSPFPGYFQALRCRPHGACQDLESPKMTEDKMRRILDSRNEHDSSEWDDGKNASEQEHFVLGGLEDARFLMRIVQNWLERGVDLLVLAAGFPCLVRLLGSPLGKHHVVVVIRHIAPRLARDETRLALRHGLHLFHETRDRWLETAAHHSLRQDTHRTRHVEMENGSFRGRRRHAARLCRILARCVPCRYKVAVKSHPQPVKFLTAVHSLDSVSSMMHNLVALSPRVIQCGFDRESSQRWLHSLAQPMGRPMVYCVKKFRDMVDAAFFLADLEHFDGCINGRKQSHGTVTIQPMKRIVRKSIKDDKEARRRFYVMRQNRITKTTVKSRA
ncbi:hypothetical protein Ae201684_009715 [Aphanomyces euteiches]|uniref:Uncharacterized protein n=1 Tax=Aphanomyces euteiches TaxID=100861 RepID=A0A6G0X0V8_9STRA|nr:hypothetical protein Ae201684_009715 [Aphanomyces euteiches]